MKGVRNYLIITLNCLFIINMFAQYSKHLEGTFIADKDSTIKIYTLKSFDGKIWISFTGSNNKRYATASIDSINHSIFYYKVDKEVSIPLNYSICPKPKKQTYFGGDKGINIKMEEQERGIGKGVFSMNFDTINIKWGYLPFDQLEENVKTNFSNIYIRKKGDQVKGTKH